jgi:hypothetical protein
VLTKHHQINNHELKVKLYYKDFGIDPFDIDASKRTSPNNKFKAESGQLEHIENSSQVLKIQSILSMKQFNHLVDQYDFIASTRSRLSNHETILSVKQIPVEYDHKERSTIQKTDNNSTASKDDDLQLFLKNMNIDDSQQNLTVVKDNKLSIECEAPHANTDSLDDEIKLTNLETNKKVKIVLVRVKSMKKNQRPILPKLTSKAGPIDGVSSLHSSNSLVRIESACHSTGSISDHSVIDSILTPNSNDSKTPTNQKTKNAYGYVCISQSIDKLKPHEIQYLKMTHHLENFVQKNKYLHLNLKEKFKLLYLHGPQKYVYHVKNEIQNLLSRLKYFEFKIEAELAKYLTKPFSLEKLNQFVQTQIKQLDDFCHFEICNSQLLLLVYTNVAELGNDLFAFIIENIHVNCKLNLTNKLIIDMIKEYEPDSLWAGFYYTNFHGILDYRLVEEYFSESESDESGSLKANENVIISDLDGLCDSYFLELTGFKEDVERFCDGLKEIFHDL